jgi:tRNA modification GTPase
MARAWEQIVHADAVLFLHDLTRDQDPSYQQAEANIQAKLAGGLARHVPVLHLWNKADVCDASKLREVTRDGVSLSAKTGQGLTELRKKLLEFVGWQSGSAEGVYMARERHVQALRTVEIHLEQARACLNAHTPALDVLAEELRLGQNALNGITGEFTSDDLLGVIFSSFCIGK